ncbi:hemerythrin domain-containing protein [Ottowia sp.]|uniref:hemerythrin domain-containing protein n=1 Tax=Ottowia sp. TaxID=1898956 RepID=UPI003A87BC1F
MTTKTPAPPADAPVADTLFQFLDATHQRMQQELAHMNRVVDALVADRLTPEDLTQLASTVQWFDTVARQHHLDEEKHVFPTLMASDDAHVVDVTRRLRQDHGWIEQNWLEMGPHLSAVVGGNHWIEPALVREMVRVFTQLCLDHLALEESLAYPQARAHIAAQDLARADKEMAQRRESYQAKQETKR